MYYIIIRLKLKKQLIISYIKGLASIMKLKALLIIINKVILIIRINIYIN